MIARKMIVILKVKMEVKKFELSNQSMQINRVVQIKVNKIRKFQNDSEEN